ncbi:MAG TPA: hybrid sensor histidine kinase/response regulator, partial [Cyanobacteria bacterium UBA8803]|nr:hybrid sensor histidine kinase/response regulator [Cyanobacteria bacterium UBA8803]
FSPQGWGAGGAQTDAIPSPTVESSWDESQGLELSWDESEESCSSLGEAQDSEPSVPNAQDDEEPVNLLLESIWGSLPSPESEMLESADFNQQNLELETGQESGLTEKPLTESTSQTGDRETHKASEEEAQKQELAESVSVAVATSAPPSPISAKDLVSVSDTVRVNVEHLKRLNYSVGELLTNQNRQLLENEQLHLAVRDLLIRLQNHQRLLDQLQDWYDRSFNWSQQRHEREWGRKRPGTIPMGDSPNPFDPLELEAYSSSQVLIQSVIDDAVQLAEATEAIDLFARQADQTLEKQRRLLGNTRDTLMEARMLPLGEIFCRFPRVLQQLETLHNKPVALELQGTEVLVDKVIAQKLYDPLLHLVRNAFDHGIELPQIRQQLSKPNQGQIKIRAYYSGRYLVIEVRDDGQGLDFPKIRQRAAQLFFSPERVSSLSEAQLTDLLFEPGFSTASGVNDLSGRGIGLDVVRAQLQALQGVVTVDSEFQRGTTFRLQIPLSLTISKLLLVQAGEQVYALLADAVEQILMPGSDQIRSWEDGKVLRWGKGTDERLIPIFSLAKVLDYGSQNLKSLLVKSQRPLVAPEQASPVILLRCEDQLLGLEVDQLIGEQELVIRPLGAIMLPPSYVYGGSILADGRLTLVIDGAALMQYISDRHLERSSRLSGSAGASAKHLYPVEDLSQEPANFYLPSGFSSGTQSVQRQLSSQTQAALPASPDLDFQTRQQKMVLLVDDSITVRQSLSLTLQNAGYQVFQAKDGYEAIEQLRHNPNIELVICDIEMPRMNGFEFLKYRQQDSSLAKIPVVILTSRSGEKHRLIASELGAVGYITKPYLEPKLLKTVSEVIEPTLLGNS